MRVSNGLPDLKNTFVTVQLKHYLSWLLALLKQVILM